MNTSLVLIAAGIGYLFGSVSFARVVARLFAPGIDPSNVRLSIQNTDEKFQVGVTSATTLSMQGGPKLGFLTAMLDMLKVALPTLYFKTQYPGEFYFLVTALGGMVGHVWPVWYRFKGGRGLTAVYGAMFTVDWVGTFVTFFGGMLLGIIVIRDLLVAYLSGLWLLVIWLWFRTHEMAYVWYGLAANLIFLFSMIPEIKQYLDLRRRGFGADIGETVQLTGMGRGIYRFAKRLKLIRDSK
ncbi:MAG: Glycerol-3-phosphate acyltransferase [Anaerolineales bacterium]|nr:glycerol-3-phosphate acyltransferase [Anaerolineae bacterium]MBL8106197.1 glycerol-3-phosphate acyltransferase [Anaerolineales bacterium]MBV6400822.1 Glycerol-3-phosphate acyltransferase [Anaerolineales bacterium]MCC7187430.1 glycerol-3-phosphate acyltransferase [Anaerolineales bacterium]